MKNENDISVERMIELENWLIDNYPVGADINDTYSFFLSNFYYEEANYLLDAYLIPFHELSKLISDYDKEFMPDEVRFFNDLLDKYGINEKQLFRRIIQIRKIQKYYKKHINKIRIKEIKKYNKLVRDNIPNIIENNDGVPVFRTLDDKDYWNALLKKVDEEKLEVSNALTKEERKKELADLLELIKAMAEFNGFTLSEIEEEANIKRSKNGGFTRKIYLEKVIEK